MSRDFRMLRTHLVASMIRNTEPLNPFTVSDLMEFLYIHPRNILLTREGHIGIGRGSFREGDIITMLRGDNMPIILWPWDKFYKFLGAYMIFKWISGLAIKIWNWHTYVIIQMGPRTN